MLSLPPHPATQPLSLHLSPFPFQTPIANQASTVLRGIFTNPALHLTAAEAAARVAAATRIFYTLLERELRIALAAGAPLGDLPALLATSRRLGTPALVMCAELVDFALAGAPATGEGAVCTFPVLTAQAGQLAAAPWVWDAGRAVALALDEAGAPAGVLRPLAYMRARLEEELVWGPGSEAFSLIHKLAEEAGVAAAHEGGGGADGCGGAFLTRAALSATTGGADAADLPLWRGSVYDGPAPLEPPGLVGGSSGVGGRGPAVLPAAPGYKATRGSAAAAPPPPPPLSRLQSAAAAAVEAECVIADLLTMASHRLQVRAAAAARLLAAARSAAGGHTPLPRSYVAACALLAGTLASSHVHLMFGQHLSALVAAILYGAARAFNVAVPLKAAAAAAQAASPHVWPDQVTSAVVMAPVPPPPPAATVGGAPAGASAAADPFESCRLKDFYDGAFLDAMADELRRTVSTAVLTAAEDGEEEEGEEKEEADGDGVSWALVATHAAAAKADRAVGHAATGTKRGAAAAAAAATAATAAAAAAAALPPSPKKRASGKRTPGASSRAAAEGATVAEAAQPRGGAGRGTGVVSGVAAELEEEAGRRAGGPAKPTPRLPLKAMTAEDIASRGNAPRRGG